jgi:hypothetical protein
VATRGRPLPAGLVRQLRGLRALYSVRQVARHLGVSTNSVLKYSSLRRAARGNGG